MADESYEAYIGYLDGKDEQIAAGEPIVIEVRDLSTFERKVVRAVVAKPGSDLQDAGKLWVLDWTENRQKEPWSIRVVEELDPDEESATRSDITEEDLARAREESQAGQGHFKGTGLSSGFGAEEARKFYEHVTKGRVKKSPS